MTYDTSDADNSIDSRPFEMAEPEERTVEIDLDANGEEDETDE